MKQRLNNIRQNKLFVIIAAAVVAAILVVIITNIFVSMPLRKKLNTLNEDTRYASESFVNKLNIAEIESDKNFDGVENVISLPANENGFTRLRDIKKEINSISTDYNTIIADAKYYCISYGVPCAGTEFFEKFKSDIENGSLDKFIMIQFTSNLDPVYYFIEYNGDNYHIVVDQTKDGYDEEHGYIEAFGKYLRFETYKLDDGTVMEYGYLTDDENITYFDVLSYIIDTQSTSVAYDEPDYWQFYVTMTNEE